MLCNLFKTNINIHKFDNFDRNFNNNSKRKNLKKQHFSNINVRKLKKIRSQLNFIKHSKFKLFCDLFITNFQMNYFIVNYIKIYNRFNKLYL